MNKVHTDTLKASDAFNRLADRVADLDPAATLYVHLSVAILDPDQKDHFTLLSSTTHDPDIPQPLLASIQQALQDHLRENAVLHGKASGKAVPFWAQPPRLLYCFRWYDLILFGVLVGTVLGILLASR